MRLRAAEDGDQWGQGPLVGSCCQSPVPQPLPLPLADEIQFVPLASAVISAHSPFENRALNTSNSSGHAQDLPFRQPSCRLVKSK